MKLFSFTEQLSTGINVCISDGPAQLLGLKIDPNMYAEEMCVAYNTRKAAIKEGRMPLPAFKRMFALDVLQGPYGLNYLVECEDMKSTTAWVLIESAASPDGKVTLHQPSGIPSVRNGRVVWDYPLIWDYEDFGKYPDYPGVDIISFTNDAVLVSLLPGAAIRLQRSGTLEHDMWDSVEIRNEGWENKDAMLHPNNVKLRGVFAHKRRERFQTTTL